MKQNQLQDKLTAFVQIKGYFPGIREFQKECGYKSPRSISILYERLEKEGFITRVTPKKFSLTKNETQTIFKKYIDSLDINQLQKYRNYIDSKINFLICEGKLVSSAESNTQTLGARRVAHDVNESIE